MKTLITKYITYEDIDLVDKLDNMLDCEIAEEIYNKCQDNVIFKKIEEKIWELINNKDSKFAYTDFYEGLAKEYEAVDEYDMWSACLYNCDLLYMTAIAYVLNLEIPKSSCDVKIFGIV